MTRKCAAKQSSASSGVGGGGSNPLGSLALTDDCGRQSENRMFA